MAIHHEDAYAAQAPLDLPHTDAAAADVLMLPLYAGLTDDEQDYVIDRLTIHATDGSAAYHRGRRTRPGLMEEAGVRTIDGGHLGGPVLAGQSARTVTDVACRTLDLAVTAVALLAARPAVPAHRHLIKLDTRGPGALPPAARGTEPQPVHGRQVPHDAATARPTTSTAITSLALIESGTKAAASSRPTPA